ncbi:MAG: DUF4381 family protein [Luteolibacter sp.]
MIFAQTSLELRDSPLPESALPRFGLWPWLICLVIPLFGWILWRLWRQKKSQVADPKTIRDQALRDALDEIAAIKPAHDIRQQALDCSQILRRYLATTTQDPAWFETQEEFRARPNALSDFSDAAKHATMDAFDRWAKIKYLPESAALAAAADIISESRELLHTLHHDLAR